MLRLPSGDPAPGAGSVTHPSLPPDTNPPIPADHRRLQHLAGHHQHIAFRRLEQPQQHLATRQRTSGFENTDVPRRNIGLGSRFSQVHALALAAITQSLHHAG